MKHKPKRSQSLPGNVLSFILQEERRSGVILLLAAFLALFFANSSWSDAYLSFIHHEISLGSITLDIRHWISEGLMAFFFLVVVLEIKRELIDGELSTWRKASFPFMAAIGGMLFPAFIYSFLNPALPQNAGWAIPIATDIAIAVGALALVGNKIPRSLRVFLLALAIIDDIGSIIIIALFYSQPSNAMALFGVVVSSIGLLFFRRRKHWLFGFALLGFCVWYCLLLTGISGTMAGVIVAALAPLTKRARGSSLQLSEKVEDILLPLTAYIIVPLFVFTSTGLIFNELSLQQDKGFMVFLGVLGGLVVGKPLGITVASWLSIKLRLAHKPDNLQWRHILGVGFLGGIGFTVSLLITDLAFNTSPSLQNAAVFGVFVASLLSGIIGVVILRRVKPVSRSSFDRSV